MIWIKADPKSIGMAKKALIKNNLPTNYILGQGRGCVTKSGQWLRGVWVTNIKHENKVKEILSRWIIDNPNWYEGD